MVNTRDYVREFLVMFFIRKRIIVSFLIIFFTGSICIAFLWPPKYRAQGSIFLKSNPVLKSPQSIEVVSSGIPRVKDENLNSEMQLFQSIDVVEKAVVEINSNTSIFGRMDESSDRFESVVQKVYNSLSIELYPNSDIFYVYFTWDNPKKAEVILNTLMDQYMECRNRIYNPKEAQDFFSKQLTKFDDKLRKLEDESIKVAEQPNVVNPEEKIKNNLLIERELKMILNSLQIELVEKRNKVEYLRKTLSSNKVSFFSTIDNPSILNLSKRLQENITEKTKLLTMYQPGSNMIKQVDQKIKDLDNYLRSEVRGILADEESKLKILENQIHDVQMRIQNTNDINLNLYKSVVQSNRIKRDKDLLEDSYNTFAKRLEEARIDTATTNRLFSVSIVSRPHASPVPVFPNKKKVIFIGILLGMVIGSMFGFLVEFFDHTFKRPEDVRNYVDLPTLYSIPKFS